MMSRLPSFIENPKRKIGLIKGFIVVSVSLFYEIEMTFYFFS